MVTTDPSPDPGRRRGTNGLRSPAAGAALTIAVLVAIPYLIPGLERLRLLTPLPEGEGIVLSKAPEKKTTVGEAQLPAADFADLHHFAQPEKVEIPAEAAKVLGPVTEQEKPPVSLEDRSNKALDSFYRVLEDVQRDKPGTIARILVWGDSNIASDLVPSVLRRKLQQRFGDSYPAGLRVISTAGRTCSNNAAAVRYGRHR